MSYTIYYWTACQSFWGRAIGIVLTLEEAGVPYEIKQHEESPAGVAFTYPTLMLDTGQTLGQTPAILNVLGEKFGLTGKTDQERILCQETVLQVNDIFSEAQSGKFKEKPERADKWFALLEGRLEAHQFLVRNEPTVADFHAVFAFEWVHKSYSPEGYAAFPKLTQWWQDICEHPCVKKMKNSGTPMIP